MSLPATVHEKELRRVADSAYTSKSFKVCLVDAPGSTFDADDPKSTILAGEVQAGLGGYQRQQITLNPADLGAFNAGKLAYARKAVTFTHNGEINQIIRFSHVVVLNPTETEVLCERKLSSRCTLSDSQSAIFYFDLTLYGVFVAN